MTELNRGLLPLTGYSQNWYQRRYLKMQTKKLSVVLALASFALCSMSAFAATKSNVLTPCSVNGSNGLAVVPQVVAVGSSAQFNTFAYAAAELLTAQAGDTGINSSDYNLLSASGGITINDLRLTPTLGDSANPVFFIWDNATTCNLYAYFTTDSGIGNKDFFATRSIFFSTPNKTYDVAGAVVVITTPTGPNEVAGLSDTTTTLPSAIKNYFNNPWIPVYSGSTLTNAPLPYCGTTTAQLDYGWCVFNMVGTDIRPEDALYATTRALSTLSTSNYNFLGYSNTLCDAGQADEVSTGNPAPATSQGCPIFDSFGQHKIFNVLKFALSGADPFTTGTHVPPYTTISLGAVPALVIVQNGDSAGFGATSSGNYTIHDVNRGVLSQVFQGNLHCTGDFLPGYAGSGSPIQEIQREPLSGTYNTFEFTAVRTLTGSSNGATTTASATAWPSNEDRSMEAGVNPSVGFSTAACGGTYTFGSASTLSAPNGTTSCGDPLWLPTGTSGKACGAGGFRARAIGTGEEVKATMALDGSSGGIAVTDGAGYSFWGYGNLAPMATGCGTSTNQTDYNTTCGFLGHYLTVDGIDPLFNTPGGANDSPANPAGAYNPPQCNFGALPCFSIPFTHVKDGSYPLWTLLRDVTIGTSTADKTTTPAAVLTLIAYAQYDASQNDRVSDFVPFLNITSGGLSTLSGSLNLGVFREHFHNTNNPVNGYAACGGNFSSITITGAAGSCTVDAGGDVGGTVMTVQSDVDFNDDFGSLFVTSPTGRYEIYDQHQ
jgi:hypothetical protein